MDFNNINEKVASLEAQLANAVGDIVTPKQVKEGFVEDPRLTLNNEKKIQKAIELNDEIAELIEERGTVLSEILSQKPEGE